STSHAGGLVMRRAVAASAAQTTFFSYVRSRECGPSRCLLPVRIKATITAPGELPDHPFQEMDQPRPAGSEQFRIVQRTGPSLRARLRVRETHRTGVGDTHVGHETARLHHAPRRGGRVAARGARAAAGDAGDWIPQWQITG